MGGHITRKPQGAHVRHEKALVKLEKRLSVADTAEALQALTAEYHSLVYALGHDIAAIIAMPDLVDRASHGELRANECAGEAHARVGEVAKAVYAMFRALETYPDDHQDRVRIVNRIAEFLGPFDPSMAAELRKSPDGLPDDVADARQAFADRMRVAQNKLDWDALPNG